MGITQLILSSGRSASHNTYMGGNAFEALVGALYLDHGYNACMLFIKKQILSKMVNIDKVAYKEVNFKSKLIEWTQKNRVMLDFKCIKQDKDENGSPTFEYICVLEGIEACGGKGFSKKEAQQHAAEETLKKLRKQPKFCDDVFKAKTNRTKMEEEPVMAAPDIEKEIREQKEFIVSADNTQKKETPKKENNENNFDVDFSDVQPEKKEMTREDIIAAAEEAAFNNKDSE
jgi:ribonuclease-3